MIACEIGAEWCTACRTHLSQNSLPYNPASCGAVRFKKYSYARASFGIVKTATGGNFVSEGGGTSKGSAIDGGGDVLVVEADRYDNWSSFPLSDSGAGS